MEAISRHPYAFARDTYKQVAGVGVPLLGAANAIRTDNPDGIHQSLLGGAAYTGLASPFGLVGSPLVYKGLTEGGNMGAAFLRSSRSSPQFQRPKIFYPDSLYNS